MKRLQTSYADMKIKTKHVVISKRLTVLVHKNIKTKKQSDRLTETLRQTDG